MRTRKAKPAKKGGRPPVAGTVRATIQLPASLYDAMKAIRQIRHEQEGSDVRLSRLYREAVELYVNAEPQQALLAQTAA